jgi:nitrate/TMAO reductase-like tetraheme cytochrome c subunit
MKPIRTCIPVLVVFLVVWIGVASADGRPSSRPPPPPVYVEECGSCHVAYPARFLGASSWSAVLAGLESHFGVDASVDPRVLEELRGYLLAGARSRETVDGAKPLLRITQTPWFRHEHPRPSASVWAHPDVKSPANCGACHRQAESGDYRERSLRMPKKGETK